MRKKRAIRLDEGDRTVLNNLLLQTSLPARVRRRARMLLESDQGKTDREVALLAGCSTGCVADMRRRFADGGMHRALYDAARSGAPRKFSDDQLRRIVNMRKGPPPEGKDRWTLEEVCRQAVARGIVTKISIGRVHQLMNEHGLMPPRTKARD